MHLYQAYRIWDISHHSEPQDLVRAKVSFSYKEDLGDDNVGEVQQYVEFEVRFLCPESVTISEVHEMIHRKALEVLSRARAAIEGTPAKQLLSEAAEADRSHQAELDRSWPSSDTP